MKNTSSVSDLFGTPKDPTYEKLSASTLDQIEDFMQSTLKMTRERLRMLRSVKTADPHIKLFIIDLVNYLMTLLSS